MSENRKIVIFGPVGAGKTTAIKTLCNADCLQTEGRSSDSTRQRKETTTVAFDYGHIDTPDHRIHVYGTPGQSRFRFMWEMICNELAHDCCGYFLLLDNSRNHPRKDLDFYLDQIRQIGSDKPVIIGVTHSDRSNLYSQADYTEWLSERGEKAPVLFIDARLTSDMQMMVDLLIPASANTTDSEISVIEEELDPFDQFFDNSTPDTFSRELLDSIASLDEIQGLALINQQAEAVYSTLNTQQLSDLYTVCSRIIPLLKTDQASKHHDLIRVKAGRHHYAILISDHHLLGIGYPAQFSLLKLQQELDNLMQWQSLQTLAQA